MNDDDLFQRMRASQPTFSFPSEYQREIWSRIEAEERLTPAERLRRLFSQSLAWLARPIPAVCLAVLMAASGCLLAAGKGPRYDRRMAEEVYVKAVSPFASAKVLSR